MTLTSDAFVMRFNTPSGREDRQQGFALSGLRVAVKDNFDIAGYVTGAGNPEFAANGVPAARSASVVTALLDHGAVLCGKTQMDELAYSLMGVNARYGTPLNPRAPQRVPGGSSSGSASAVASGDAEIGLGSDTGGSVRMPSSFCGLFGWRPTHGLMGGDGLVPLAPSFDTAGFITRDLATLQKLGAIFAGTDKMAGPRYWLPPDIWAVMEAPTAEALAAAWPGLAADRQAFLPDGNLSEYLPIFRVHQSFEAWQALGPFIEAHEPAFGPGIRERFAAASRVTADEFDAARAKRQAVRAHVAAVLPDDLIMVIPTAPGPAPLQTMPLDDLEKYRNRALTVYAIAGLAGLPQVTLPVTEVDGAPVGLSLVGAPGTDAMLLRAAETVLSAIAARS